MAEQYVDIFAELCPMPGFRKKAPHKAILLLSVIELYECGVLDKNEIRFDSQLKKTFYKYWGKYVDNPHYSLDMTLPFWNMKDDRFWHLIPYWTEEDLFQGLNSRNIELTEDRLVKCVNYAELDEDLYFLLTMSYCRDELYKTILMSHFGFDQEEADRLAQIWHLDNSVSYKEITASSTIESLLTKNSTSTPITDAASMYADMSLDLRILLNIGYFSFLRDEVYNRDEFMELCPDIVSYIDLIVFNSSKAGSLSSSLKSALSSLLRDTRASVMLHNDSIAFIEGIDRTLSTLENEEIDEYSELVEPEVSLDSLFDEPDEIEEDTVESEKTGFVRKPLTPCPGSRRGMAWTEEEEHDVTCYYYQGYSIDEIASAQGRTQSAIKSRLILLGVIEEDFNDEDVQPTEDANTEECNDIIEAEGFLSNFTVVNGSNRSSIINKRGEPVYSSNGNIIIIEEKPYRFYKTYSAISINEINQTDDKTFFSGIRLINANHHTPLFKTIENLGENAVFEAIKIDETSNEVYVKINSSWFGSKGYIAANSGENIVVNKPVSIELIDAKEYRPKGQLPKIMNVADSSYDYLWILAIVDLCRDENTTNIILLDDLSCMMIAEAWEIFHNFPEVIKEEGSLNDCIEYLIEESQYVSPLYHHSSKELVYSVIRNLPIAGVFEDVVDELVISSPITILKAWFNSSNEAVLIEHSLAFNNSCLYALHMRKKDPYIEINSSWIKYLRNEHDNLHLYFVQKYIDFVNNNYGTI